MTGVVEKWSHRKLAEIAASIDYGLTASATTEPVGPKFLRITDIQEDSVDWNTVPFCHATPSEVSACRLAAGDIVFARTGATTGKSFLIRHCPNDSVFASYLIRVRPESLMVEPRYLAWFFQTPNYWNQIATSTSGTAQPGVNATKLKELVVPLPNLQEQHRIADILDKADSMCRKRKEAIRLTEELLRSVFLEMYGDPVANPLGWDVEVLGQVADFYAGASLPVGERFSGQQGGVLLLKVGDMNLPGNEMSISIAREWAATGDGGIVAPAGSILIPKRGGAIATNKKRLLTRPAALDPNLMAIQPHDGIELAYLRQWLELLDLANLCSGSTVPQLNKKDLAPLLIAVPPAQMQARFAAIATSVLRMRTHASDASSCADGLLSALVQRAFSGRL